MTEKPCIVAELDGQIKMRLFSKFNKTDAIISKRDRQPLDQTAITVEFNTTGKNPRRSNMFYKLLRSNVKSFDTLGWLADVKRIVRSALDKHKGIESDLVRGNERYTNRYTSRTEEVDWDQSCGRECCRKEHRIRKWIFTSISTIAGLACFQTQSKYPQQEPRCRNQCVY